MKNTLRMFLILLMSLSLALAFSACSGSSEGGDDAQPEEETQQEEEEDGDEYLPFEEEPDFENGISFDEELEGTELEFKEVDENLFIGDWESTSGHSVYLYGNIDLSIKADGTWTGNVAEEPLEGTWTFDGTTFTLNNELLNATLSFTEDDVLVMQEYRFDDVEPINIVLTPAKK